MGIFEKVTKNKLDLKGILLYSVGNTTGMYQNLS